MIYTTAYIGLGSNLDDRLGFINKALDALKANTNIDLLRVSDFVETKPLGNLAQPNYLNAAAELKTSLKPQELLDNLQEIENGLGRKRSGQKWQSRTIDLDILLYGDKVIETENLTIPHKQMHLRSFVLKNLCQLNPQLPHPVLKTTVSRLAERLNGGDFVLDADKPQLISVAGLIGVGKTTLAGKLVENISAELILEPYDTNPFLPQVYAGKKELSLHSQLFFLLNRTEQLSGHKFTPAQKIITDYIFEKELIYADCLLETEHLKLYRQLYPDCLNSIIKPSLVVYLHDSASNCLERIHKRNRPYEQKITPEFLGQLEGKYEKLFENWQNCPVIKISKSQFDCNNKKDLQYLINQIDAYIVP